jgi:hypothetical protein
LVCEEPRIASVLKRYERGPQGISAPPEYKALHPVGAAPIIPDIFLGLHQRSHPQFASGHSQYYEAQLAPFSAAALDDLRRIASMALYEADLRSYTSETRGSFNSWFRSPCIPMLHEPAALNAEDID